MKNNYKIMDNYAIIYYKSFEIFVDINDLNRIIDFGYSVSCHRDRHGNNRYYPSITKYLGLDKETGKAKYKTFSLHSFIMNFPEGVIDHEDGNSLNNRKYNLIKTNQEINTKNRHKINSNNTSGYRNVTLMNGCWRIQLQINGKNHLFSEKFTDVDKAGRFAEEMRQKYYGEHAGFN